MAILKKIVLDVLKPHQPNVLDFSTALADQINNVMVHTQVSAIDDKTQSVITTLSGDNLDYPAIERAITTLGGSVHSIDEVLTLTETTLNEGRE